VDIVLTQNGSIKIQVQESPSDHSVIRSVNGGIKQRSKLMKESGFERREGGDQTSRRSERREEREERMEKRGEGRRRIMQLRSVK